MCFGEEVNDFGLALITPLGTDDYCYGHTTLLKLRGT
jgi:hypothetical protein